MSELDFPEKGRLVIEDEEGETCEYWFFDSKQELYERLKEWSSQSQEPEIKPTDQDAKSMLKIVKNNAINGQEQAERFRARKVELKLSWDDIIKDKIVECAFSVRDCTEDD